MMIQSRIALVGLFVVITPNAVKFVLGNLRLTASGA